MRPSLISHTAVWALCVCLLSPAQAADPALPTVLKAQVQAILQTSKVAGATVLLVDALGVSAAYLHGDARPSTCHAAGAAGDALIALAAMRLAEQDKVDLYASLASSLPKSVGVSTSATCKTKVSLSRLLEHTSGVGGSLGQTNACPSSRATYSASGVQLAALALEKSTNLSINTLMKREVFGPLAMESSDWGYAKAGEMVASSCPGASTDAPAQARAGLTTKPHDMANMLKMLVQRGQVDAKTYLPQCAVERMGISVSAVSVPGGNTVAAMDRAEYGLGLQRFKVGGQLWLGYSGDLQDSRWVWGYSSQSQSAMVIMVNGQDAKTLRALKIAVATYLQKDAAKVLISNR